MGRLATPLAVTVALVALLSSGARAEQLAPVPIVLVHGICGEATGTFGDLPALLEADLPGVTVHAFDYSSRGSSLPDGVRASLRSLAGELGAFIERLDAPHVDVVAHSMGGLIARAWMAGLADDGPPYAGQVRQLVTAGTPHFGVPRHVLRDVLTVLVALGRCGERILPVLDAQIDQMLFGSAFLADLNTAWETAPVAPDHILTVVGCVTVDCEHDLVVAAASAALPITSPDSHAVHVLHAHSGLLTVTHREQPVYRAVLPFLRDGSPGPGIVPEAPGSLVVARLVTAQGRPFTRDDDVRFGTMRGQPSLPACNGWDVAFFRQEPPLEATGWWTLGGVNPGCWELAVRSRLFDSSTETITVVPGRPVLSDPIVVRRRHLRQ
jgi:pimeloyl-ACP methyl ester carboxylesterase